MVLLLVSAALAAPPVLNVLPFGVGVYAHKKPVRGIIYSVTQAGGIAGWYGATWPARYAAGSGDDAALGRWQAVLAGAASLTIGSYIVSVIDGGHLHDLHAEPVAWSDPRLPDVPLVLPPVAGLSPARLPVGASHGD